MVELAGDSRLIENLTYRLSKDAGQLIDEIQAALTRKDRGRFQELMHALKGAAMMAGAIRLRDSVVRVENTAGTSFESVSADMIEDLRRTLAVTNHELSRMVA
jgi:HPt (histidine-containing phosphotransfer) domain-containing protein